MIVGGFWFFNVIVEAVELLVPFPVEVVLVVYWCWTIKLTLSILIGILQWSELDFFEI